MLSRRAASRVALPTALSSNIMTQKRFDHDRWYGHALELDIHIYKYTNEKPGWLKKREKSAEDTNAQKKYLPYFDFASSYEALIFDADRLNPHLNRKEFDNENKFRLEKQSNTVSRAQKLISEGEHAKNPEVEDIMIARIADEEHCQAEMKYVKCIRANEFAEDNRLDILPGGSPNSLREKTRWNLNPELHPIDRKEIMDRLMAWLPEKYHIVYTDDFQTAAANDKDARKEMLAIVDFVAKELEAEAKANKYEEDLKEVVQELADDVDPTRHITTEKIRASNNLDELEEWSRLVHEYNGDNRILDIYERAAQLTKNADHQQLVADLRQWTKTIYSKM